MRAALLFAVALVGGAASGRAATGPAWRGDYVLKSGCGGGARQVVLSLEYRKLSVARATVNAREHPDTLEIDPPLGSTAHAAKGRLFCQAPAAVPDGKDVLHVKLHLPELPPSDIPALLRVRKVGRHWEVYVEPVPGG